MEYDYITIPTCWLTKELLNKYVDEKSVDMLSENKSLILTYYTLSGRFSYSDIFCKLHEHEHICNSPEEFDEQVSKARLELVLRSY